METTEAICKDLVDTTANCVAVGVVEMNTGMMLGLHVAGKSLSQDQIEAVAAAAVDLFRGTSALGVGQLLGLVTESTASETAAEMLVSYGEALLFMKAIGEKQSVAILATKLTKNQGMGWAALRSAIPRLYDTIP